MANTIGTAYIQIEPTTSGIQGSLSNILDSEATAAGTSAGGKLSGALGSAAQVGVTAIAGLTTAVVGAGTALTSAASATAQYGDNIDKMSQKLGVSSSFYQEWDAVLQHSGTSMDSMSATFKKLATASQDASAGQEEAFQKLGLSMEQVQSMSTEELFTSVITGLQGMEEGTQRTALATELLGKGAMEMGALLNTSSEDTQAMIDNVNALGGVMSEDAVHASAQFQDSLQDMQTAFAGVKNQAMSELLPSFSEIMGGLTGLVTGTDGASEQLSSGMESLVGSVTENLPRITESFVELVKSIAEVAPELISSLAEGIIESIPELLPTLIQLVTDISTMLIENLPMLVEAGLEIIVSLAQYLTEALPELIPTIVDVMLQIVDTLLDNIDLLIDAALNLILALAEGLINALPKLIEKIPEIIIKLVEAITRNLPKILEAGITLIIELAKGLIKAIPQLVKKIPEIIKAIVEGFKDAWETIKEVGGDIVSGIWEGIKSAWEGLKKKVSELADGLVDGFKDFFHIGSPSKLMRDEIGRWIPEGIAVGIEANADSVTDAVDDIVGETLLAGSALKTDFANDYNYNTQSINNTEGTMEAIFGLLQTYLPNVATNDKLNNLNFNVNNREFARLVNGVV